MNYYNPYLFNMPTNFAVPKASSGLISRIFGNGGLKLGSILNGTQKVLNFTNQLIPVVKQVQPMVKNAKTMFRVMNEFKKTDNKYINDNSANNKQKNNTTQHTINNQNNSNQGPTFFM